MGICLYAHFISAFEFFGLWLCSLQGSWDGLVWSGGKVHGLSGYEVMKRPRDFRFMTILCSIY